MKNRKLPLQNRKRSAFAYLLTSALSLLIMTVGNSQCIPQTGTVDGFVFQDVNFNGIKDPGEAAIANVRVSAFNAAGSVVSNMMTDINGNYRLSNLPDGSEVRLTFQHASYHDGYMGQDNGTRVQFVRVPSCAKGVGLSSSLQYCNEDTRILTTCFVQGPTSALPAEPTIVGMEYGFNLGSLPQKLAMYSETGTIWGVAWNKKQKALYSSAFIKQYGGLTNHGHDAIFKTLVPEGAMSSTSLFVKLSDLGQDVGTLTTQNINDCSYGAQVGKIGLGALEISPDQKLLYTINLYNNTLVVIPTENPKAANTQSYKIPDPGCSHGEYRAFALKMYNNKLYVGVTCTAETAKSDASSSANVYEFDPAKKTFTLIFSTPYLKGYWKDSEPGQIFTSQWLTDIDFTDDGHMLLGLSDRIGHRYCTVNFTNRLDDQRPDLLMVAYNNVSKTWELENNGKVANLTGTGVGNGQGPGGGEFFGKDHWPKDPAYHPEVALGSIFVMPGTNSVVATVFDPHLNAYSGGLHRYSTNNGDLLGALELYRLNTTVAFGKATGFGDIVATCIEPSLEIGNRVWNDTNKNGIQDAGEPGLEGIGIVLYNSTCDRLAQMTTDVTGQYYFNEKNVAGGLSSGETYYLGIDPNTYDAQALMYNIDGKYFTVSGVRAGEELLGSKALETLPGCTVAQIEVNTLFSNQNFDFGLYNASECGMRIEASVKNTEAIRFGSSVTYEICVTNTGTLPVNGWALDYKMPKGNVLDGSLNQGWTPQGSVFTKSFNQVLGRGVTFCTEVVVNFNAQETNPGFTHEFSINRVLDLNNNLLELVSACSVAPEDIVTVTTPAVFDLALKHELNENGVFSNGSEVKMNTTVFNQGNVAAKSYTVINYLNEAFIFDPAKNPGWVLSPDARSLTFVSEGDLYPGENRIHMLILTLRENAPSGAIINYAEILESYTDLGIAVDFDSDSDDDVKNDNGGVINSITDNMINDSGVMDEDDHDPVVVLLDVVDVAIIKKAVRRELIPGQESKFSLEIINEGTVSIQKFVLRDYIPQGLSLMDANWVSLPDNIAERTIELEKPLRPGESTFTDITLLVSQNLTGPKVLTNVVQVYKIYDTNLKEISDLDYDSNLSLTVVNNETSVLQYLGQDNYSSADVVLLGNIEIANPCICLNNASNPFDGQFSAAIGLESASGETWFIQQVTGLYDEFSPLPPASPIPFITGSGGFILDETVLGNGISRYSFEGNHIEGEGFFIVLQNNFGLTRSYRLDPGTCRYNTVQINGLTSVCNSITSDYSVALFGNDYIFSWTLDGNPIGADQNSVSIDWSLITDGQHVLRLEVDATALDQCYSPVTLNISSGVGDAGAISCISNVNVSLDENCQFTVTPSVLIAGTFNVGSPYQVILMDKNGAVIPNATLTIEHLGQNIMAKLIDGCGGNSCWATIFVEDKIPPRTFCQDIVLACHELDTYVGPFESDNCGGEVENTLLYELVTPYVCNELYIKQIGRRYIAKDKAGNVSLPCDMTIFVARPNLREIVIPADRTMANNNPLVCDNFPLDKEGRPSPEVTGVPTLFGDDLYPNYDETCNVYTGFTDRDLGKINCVRKIAREWVIFESWCSNATPLRFTQMIEITDTIPPVIAPIADITVSASVGDCIARVQLPLAVVTDECEGVLRVDIVYPGGFALGQNTAFVELPSGINTIKYIAYDECGNRDSLSYTITVLDRTSPTTICKGELVVSLNSSGEAYMRPDHVNDGSWDACGISHYEIRRMVAGCGNQNNVFGQLVDFCCADVGNTIIVEMRVTDINNNSNTCMIPVTVQDKFAPQITCPPNETRSCDENIDIADLSEFGTAVAVDACGATVTELTPVSSLNQCRTGVIERIFEARDNLGFARCSQFITIENYDPFNENDIVWPLDFETNNGCTASDLHPDNLDTLYSYPVITEDFCDNVGVTFKDQVFNFVPNACFKIVRTWYVIDWCAMENNPNYQPITWQQTIKVQNEIAPVITSSCDSLTQCTPKDNCVDGFITLGATATDVCTPANLLSNVYKIDANNDGTYDIEVTGFGGTINASGVYPVGTHRIQYSFEDRCGNVTTCDQIFTIVNCDSPTAICVERVSVGLVPMDTDGDGENDIEMACILAASLDAGSSHPCSDSLCFAFSATDTTFTEYCYDCFDLGTYDLTLYVIDKIGGGVSECVIQVEVQDNNDVDVCPDLEECIVWPGAVDTTGCALLIANVGFDKIPAIQSDCDCNDVTVTHEDNPPVSCGDDCITTSRIWTVTFNCFSRPISYNYSQSITVIDDTPNAEITGNNIICRGSSTALTAKGGGTYLWSTGQTTESITVSPQNTTNYRVTVTSALGCTAIAQISVTVQPLPTVQIQGNRTICLNQSTTLTAVGGVSYVWSNGQTTPSVTVSPVNTMSFTVTATDANGCLATATATIIVNALPTVQIQGTSPICVGQSTTLTASGGTAYLWSNGQTTAAITVSPVASQTYTVTVTNQNTCSNTGSFNVVVNPLPVVNITGDNVICRGETTTLTATGGTSYVWTTGQTTASIQVSPTQTTLYRVTVTNSNGCSASNNIIVEVNPLPNVTITGNLNICAGENTTLTATGGPNYLWSTGQTTASINVAPTQTTTYTVTVTNFNQCSASQSATVHVSNGNATCETRDTTVYLDAMGMVAITPALISIGDTTGCDGDIEVEVTPANLFCNQIGVNTVTLRVINVTTMDTLECFAEVTVLDTLVPSLVCPADLTIGCLDYDPDAPLSVFGQATFSDNCMAGLEIEETPIANLNVCNVGIITRTFVVTDNSGNSAQCVQSITIEPTNGITEDDITWPQDTVTIFDCTDATPMNTGIPEVNDEGSDCSIISIDYEDINLPLDGSGCADTIIRTWTVVDSCHLVPGTNDGIFTFTQIIFVNDTTAPVFFNLPPAVVDVTVSVAECAVYVDFSGIIATDCDTNLILTNNGFWADNENSIDPSGTYDVGIYPITITAQDHCGNIAEYSFLLKVHAFRSLCTKQFLEMPDTLTKPMFARRFFAFTNVCPQTGHFLETYSYDLQDTVMILDCSDLSMVGIDLTVYIWDTRSGDTLLWDSCRTQYFLTDTNDFCNGGRGIIYGSVESLLNDPLSGVDVTLNGMNTLQTDVNGLYREENAVIGESYNIKPRKVTGVLDGVSTLDLVLIQRHIMELSVFDDPYMYLAGDINNDKKLNSLDLVELRKVILGVKSEFPNNDSWRFLPNGFNFADPSNPLGSFVPDSYFLESLSGTMNVSFKGLKVGDVNQSYEAQQQSVDQRSNDNLHLRLLGNKVTSKGNIEIPAENVEDVQLTGFQFALKTEGLNNIRIESDVIRFTDENYHVSNGYIFISWSQQEPVYVKAGEVLFVVKANTAQTGSISQLISLDKDVMFAESYNHELKVAGVQIGYGQEHIHKAEFLELGNIPNPWSQSTNVQFYVPQPGNVDLVVRDIAGKIIVTKKAYFDKGVQQFELLKTEVLNSGVLLYELKFNDTVKTGKMVLID